MVKDVEELNYLQYKTEFLQFNIFKGDFHLICKNRCKMQLLS